MTFEKDYYNKKDIHFLISNGITYGTVLSALKKKFKVTEMQDGDRNIIMLDVKEEEVKETAVVHIEDESTQKGTITPPNSF